MTETPYAARGHVVEEANGPESENGESIPRVAQVLLTRKVVDFCHFRELELEYWTST
jgi:hypothetical protein